MSEYGAPPPPPPPGYGQAPGYGAPMPGAEPASMGQRLLARIIDGVLLSVVGSLFTVPVILSMLNDIRDAADRGVSYSPSIGTYAPLYVASGLIGLLYEVGMIALRGATVGKQLMKIKVVQEAGGAVPGWGPGFLRWLIPALGSYLCCGIGAIVVYLSPFFDKSGRYQGWHDKVAKTLVVKA